MSFLFEKMTHHTQLEDKLGGVYNFQESKYIISLILEENDLNQYITREVPKLEGDEAKATHNISMTKDKRIIVDSIKDNLIPHVSSFNTPNKVYDCITKMFEGKNINQKMTLRNHLMCIRRIFFFV